MTKSELWVNSVGWLSLASIFGAGFTLAVAGCTASERQGPSSESETHFLLGCDAECGAGLSCTCGVCSRTCDEDAACNVYAAECLPAPESCGGSPASMCDVECESVSDCSSVAGASHCLDGRCRPRDFELLSTMDDASVLPSEPNAPSEDDASSSSAPSSVPFDPDASGAEAGSPSSPAPSTGEGGAASPTPEAGTPGEPAVGFACSLPTGEWISVPPRSADANAAAFTELTGFSVGFVAGTFYAAEWFVDQLWSYDPCAEAWNVRQVDWQGLPEVERSITWDGDHFRGVWVHSPNSPPDEEYWLDPETGIVSVVPFAAPETLPTTDWTDPSAPGNSRYVTWGDTGRYVLGWGGYGFIGGVIDPEAAEHIVVYGDGQVYDRSSGQWTAVSSNGAPSPRYRVKIVPVGERFFVWGGYGGEAWPNPDPNSELSDGAFYDPGNDTWTPVSADGAPTQTEAGHLITASDSSVLMRTHVIGSRIVLLGDDQAETRGGIYDIASDSWQAIPTPPRRLLSDGQLTLGGNLLYMEEGRATLMFDVATNAWSDLGHASSPTLSVTAAPGSTRSWAMAHFTGAASFLWGAQDFTPYPCDEVCEGGGTTVTTREGGLLVLPAGY